MIRREKTFIWSIDGLFQHVIALKYIRQYIINLFTKGSFPMVDFNLGQGFDVIGTLNYYGFGDPITIFTVLFPENEMELMYEVLIFIRMYLSGLFVAYLLITLGKIKNINNTSCLHFVPVLQLCTFGRHKTSYVL